MSFRVELQERPRGNNENGIRNKALYALAPLGLEPAAAGRAARTLLSVFSCGDKLARVAIAVISYHLEQALSLPQTLISSTVNPMILSSQPSPWRTLEEEVAFDCPYFYVRRDSVSISDEITRPYNSIRMKFFGVCIVPVDQTGHVTLVGQYRHVLSRFTWELPGGGARHGDTPVQSAITELKEETGCEAEHWLKVAEGAVSPGISDEVSQGYVAWGLRYGEAHPEPGEQLSVKQVKFREAVSMALQGAIGNLVGTATLLAIQARAEKRDLPESLLGLLTS